jgi:hypothetical protein
MLSPYLVKSEGLGRRSQPTHLDRVNPTNVNNIDNRAMGISRMLGKLTADGDYQAEAPIDTRKQSQGVQFSNNANQIRIGAVEDPDVGQFALHRSRANKDRKMGRGRKNNVY